MIVMTRSVSLVIAHTAISMQSLTGIDLGAKVVAKLTRRLLPFLFVLYIVAYLDRINVGFAALQMKGQLGFSDEVYGLGAGIFFAGYFFFQVPSNLALARFGARRWIAVIMVVWGIISASMIFVAQPARLLRAALSAGRCRSRILSRHDPLLAAVVSVRGAGTRGRVVHDGCAPGWGDRRPDLRPAAGSARRPSRRDGSGYF